MGPHRRWIDMAYFIERLLPALATIGAFVSYLIWGVDFAAFALAKGWQISSLYASVFDLSSIVCAFLLTFLILVKTTNNRVLNAYRARPEYKVLISHFVRSVVSAFVLTIATMPFLIIVPISTDSGSIEYMLVGVWFAFAAYSLSAAVRSAYEFVAVIDAAYSSRFKEAAT